MSAEYHPGADNIASLRDGIELVGGLPEGVFGSAPEGLRIGGVGSQLRHCIDFYSCFLQGLENGRVDYTRRERDPRLETDRTHAMDALERLIARLERITPRDADAGLQVRTDPTSEAGRPDWCPSTVARELQFLLSHTIHHYALIVTLLKLQGVDLGAEFSTFGVAPSTLRHWKETGTYAGS